MRIEPVRRRRHRRCIARRRDDRPLGTTSLLRLMWLASPALPVGAFSYSEGLEPAIEAGWVRDEASLAAWLHDQLVLVQARADMAVVALGVGAWRRGDTARAAELNDWVRSTRESQELRAQSEQMGRSMLEWLRQRHPGDDGVAELARMQPAPTWPLAWALAAARSGAPLRAALSCHAFGWAENMVQSALKAMPLGQSAGQRILHGLCEAIPAAVDAAIAVPDSGRQSYAPMLAIVSARHEAQYSRLFRS